MPWGLLELLPMGINIGNEEYEDITPVNCVRSVRSLFLHLQRLLNSGAWKKQDKAPKKKQSTTSRGHVLAANCSFCIRLGSLQAVCCTQLKVANCTFSKQELTDLVTNLRLVDALTKPHH